MNRVPLLFWLFVTAGGVKALAQEPSDSPQSEAANLQARVEQQQLRLRAQREEIEALRVEVVEQEQLLRQWLASKQGSAPVAASQPKRGAPKPSGIRIPVGPGQEIPTATAGVPSLKLGPADVRVQGYLGVSGIFRSASLGGGPGTSFASVPLSNTSAANITEFRLTTQTSRLALRIDVPLPEDKLSAYIEADFSGATPGDTLISGSSYGFRMRHAWLNVRHGKWEVTAGQTFSLLTPSRSNIQPWPADAATTSAVDTNYVAGLVWDRAPGLRLVYRPNQQWNLGISIENPEQQVGGSVRFPAALSSVLSNQYNTGRGELRTPNAAPDVIVKTAWNGKAGKRNLHIDGATIVRFFRSSDLTLKAHEHALGIGGNLNFILDLPRRFRLLGQAYASSGGGRYIGGLVPDVVVRADGTISPVKAYSWVSGLEWAATARIGVFGYFSGFYAARNTALDANGSPIGFGFPGSTNARRSAQEWTGGWSQVLWNGEDAGSLQYATQFSWLGNGFWASGNAPRVSSAGMVFTQFRYNLP